MLNKEQIRTEEQLRADGFNDAEIKVFTSRVQNYILRQVELDEANERKDYSTVIDLEELLEVDELYIQYCGKHPSEMPKEVLKQLNVFGVTDPNTRAYKSRIKNPATGIRAYCISCMGGQQAEVRTCPATTCQLWPFRMGTNPFANKVLPPIDIAELPEEEVINETEDAGDADT